MQLPGLAVSPHTAHYELGEKIKAGTTPPVALCHIWYLEGSEGTWLNATWQKASEGGEMICDQTCT